MFMGHFKGLKLQKLNLLGVEERFEPRTTAPLSCPARLKTGEISKVSSDILIYFCLYEI